MVKWKNPERSYATNGEGAQLQFQELKKNESFTGSVQTVDEVVNLAGYGLFQLELTLLAGFIWMSDSFEIALLSVIGQMVTCDWELIQWQNMLLTSVVFFGMIIGCPVFGALADVFGRRTSLGAATIFLFVFGVTSAASPSYHWLLAFRALVGFALGGMPQVLTYCCEYFPARVRGRADFFLSYFWAVGGIALYLVTWGIMTATRNWRALLAVAAVPAFIAIMSLKLFPESARYWAVSNQISEANRALKEMLMANKKKTPFSDLQPVPPCPRRGHVSDLLGRTFRTSTLLFWFMGAATSFCYYGMVLLSPSIIQGGVVRGLRTMNNSGGDLNNTGEGLNNVGEGFLNYFLSPVPCVEMTQTNYLDLLWTSAAELPGLLLFTILVDIIDRKKLMFLSSVTSGIFIFLLLIKTTMKTFPEAFLFIARTILVSQHQLILIMVTEAFPTTVRGVAIGAASAWYRFGALTSPYIAQFLLLWSPVAAICIFSASTIAAGVTGIFLPLETRGKSLSDTSSTEETTEIQDSTNF